MRPVVVPYSGLRTPDSGDWPRVAAELAGALRDALGEAALRAEHIGSTSISGPAAGHLLPGLGEVRRPDERSCT